MNKFISIIAAAAVALALLSGCDSDISATQANSGSNESQTQTMTGDGTNGADEYEKNLEGFIQYMSDNDFISGEGTELTSAAIGASSGRRFTVSTPVSRHTIELYEYTDQTSDIAKKTIANAKKDGSFHLFESTENVTQYTTAVVTDDGRFLMLYTDSSEGDGKNEQRQAAVEAVKNFK
ncbi:MAG: hypothetical protein IIZ59_03460 [Clostridia bacterium]|nr:hypothetical protein [Clostridia bacterium]